MTNAPVREPLLLRLRPEQGAFFYAIRRAALTLEDYFLPNIPDEPSAPFALWTMGLPSELAGGLNVTVDFLLVAKTNEVAIVSGQAQLAVISREDRSPHPNARVTPNAITFQNGRARATLQVQAATALKGYTLSVAVPVTGGGTQARGLMQASPSNPSSSLTLIPGVILPNSSTIPENTFQQALAQLQVQIDTWGWAVPLIQVPTPLLPEVAGTFGEWRGHQRGGFPHANYHAGLDLVATAGTQVYASRGGYLSTTGTASGRYVTIDHRDGFYTRYLHLSPVGLAQVGTQIKRGDPVGKVASSSENGNLRPHLHFEVRFGVPGLSDGSPGGSLDPLRQPDRFPVKEPVKVNTLLMLGVGARNPASEVYQRPTQPTDGDARSTYVVLQIKQPEPTVANPALLRNLPPRYIQFQADGMADAVTLDTPDEPAIRRLLPASTPRDGGFARYQHGNSTDYDSRTWFRYWFRWDVGVYQQDAKGPRSFTIRAANYAGQESTWTAKWGPEIENLESLGPSASGEERFRVKVRAWLGHAFGPAVGNWETGADWYRLELPEGGRWQSPAGAVLEDGSKALKETSAEVGRAVSRSYEFFWRAPASGPPAMLTARSRAVPAIAHAKLIEGTGELVPIPGMVKIPKGTFVMGSPLTEKERDSDETQHTVTISYDFYISKYEVTQGQYLAVIGNNPSFFTTRDWSAKPICADLNRPVEFVYWSHATNYCGNITASERAAGRLPAGSVYRLPTEAEWEYACRAGTTTAFHYGSALRGGMENFWSEWEYDASVGTINVSKPTTYLARTTTVGSYQPNTFGLYDMHGNVSEWCFDGYGSYPSGRVTDPRVATAGASRVVRGGAWWSSPVVCRSASRTYEAGRDFSIGFRPVLAAGQ
ncbi:MAG: SUMF1/EgtB/PvdO family nonheme iron enzyme [Verrucomicrobia bacterium]|nr:SUMF1/EgtB/PvdO family nonheme iron enzyme [Verrucomicrobiota bacterium]